MSLLAPALEIPRFHGSLVGPEDPDYDAARRVFNGMVDRRPALIARCASVSDAAAALAYARAHGLEVAVRGGGHSTPGFGTTDGGLVIDLSPLRGIAVDPMRRIAWVQPGVVWSELDAATQEHGLAVTGGRVGSTGVTGFTLGSGSGWLERKLGLAADSMRAARVLTADGRVVTASPTTNPDLFWGLRGGGGNFGIVVELELALRPVGPDVLGGMLLWPRERAGEIVRAYRELMAGAPDALCGGLALVTAPPHAPLAGEPVVAVIVLYAGEPARGEEHIAPLRALDPVADLVAPTTYCAVQGMMDGGHPDGLRDYYRSGFLDELPDAAIDALIAAAGRAPSALSAVLLQPLGGAFGRVGEMETALGHRDAAWSFQALAQWIEPAADLDNRAWVADLTRELAPWARPAGFPNFIADPGDAAVMVAYGAERLARLVEVKDAWDPENVFRLNHNIRPTT